MTPLDNHTALKSRSRTFGAVLLLCLVLGALALRAAHAQSVTILHSFYNGSVSNDGYDPLAAVVLGEDGNLYGTTYYGGSGGIYATGGGTVYKITPTGTETILHNFYDGSVINDGYNPLTALVQGRDGNFYGTTESGGSTMYWGTAFKMTPSGQVTILHNFGDGSVLNDGHYPSVLIQVGNGTFYGVTHAGGATDYGTVFKMTPSGKVTILHSFADGSVADDGYFPVGALARGRDGDFYGTTSAGGATARPASNELGDGTVFKITPSGAETVLHNFSDGSVVNDGAEPAAALVRGRDGDFYGTTYGGGGAGYSGEGTVFKIAPSGRYAVLHRFDGSVELDGINPAASLIQGHDGIFYGTTSGGGSTFPTDPNQEGYGTAFKITPAGQLTILHNFGDGTVANDGICPEVALVRDMQGDFYGTTLYGGSAGVGTVFRLSPTGVPLPALTGFSPGAGPAGSTVTLTGINLDRVTAVRFHDANAIVFSASVDGTELTVTVPEGAMKGTITVTTLGGSATTAMPFRVTYRPVITSFSPMSGPVGTVVVISGTHLDGITRLRFHEADATGYASNADGTQLTVTVPPGAQTGTITLDNRNALATTSRGKFTVTP